jgi:RNA polymerase sigma-70 factor (ECF subfamily)
LVAVPSIGRASQPTPQRSAPEADATRRLYETYARQIHAYCLHQLGNREEAEDATQSTFLNAFRGLQRGVDPEFETAWLYKIAQNVCLTRQRTSSRRRRVESPGDLDAMQDIIPAHQPDSDELIGLPEALHDMPEQQRRALLLREWQGLSYKEIAEELELSQAAVETLLFRARRTLAAGLADEPGRGVAKRMQKSGDAGSLLAIVKSLVLTGGVKVAATVATVAATSVVAATPTARHVVENAVTFTSPQTRMPKPHAVAPRPAPVVPISAAAKVRISIALPARVVASPVRHTPAPASRPHRSASVAMVTRHPAPLHVVVPVAPPAPVDEPPAAPAAPAPAPAPATPAPAAAQSGGDEGTKAADAPPKQDDAPAARAAKGSGKETNGGDHGNGKKARTAAPQTVQAAPLVVAPAPDRAMTSVAPAPATPVAASAPATTTTSSAPTVAPPAPPAASDSSNAGGNGKSKGNANTGGKKK